MCFTPTIFNFHGADVRVIKGNDGEPWFVAKDVCDVLEIANPSDALKRLDDDERASFNLGRQGNTNIINESGLYELVFGSRKPVAKAFKKWVKGTVLPAIRKDGMYVMGEESLCSLTSYTIHLSRIWN